MSWKLPRAPYRFLRERNQIPIFFAGDPYGPYFIFGFGYWDTSIPKVKLPRIIPLTFFIDIAVMPALSRRIETLNFSSCNYSRFHNSDSILS